MRISVLAAALLLASPAWAQPATPGVRIAFPTVTGAWARASAPHQGEAAVYMTLTAPSGDTLVAVAAADASMAMLHQTRRENGLSDMADLDRLDLPAGVPVSLAPQGTHIMLMGLGHPIVAGGAVPMTLTFSKAGTLRITVPVRPITAAGP